MKLLVLCQYYDPEPFRVGDLCEELSRRGHSVTVVTGVPNYPEGVVYAGYEKGQKRNEILRGVHVHRCATVARGTGVLRRVLNYYSFVVSSLRYIRSKECAAHDGTSFDIVLVYQLSPVMMAYAGLAYKKLHGVPAVLYCLDLWPESLTAGGIRRGSPIYRFYRGVSRRIYGSMDRVLTASRLFSDELQGSLGVPAERITWLPQYAEDAFAPLPVKQTDTCDLMFAGNVGSAQSVETILAAARLLRDEPSLRFHIVGGGTQLGRLRAEAAELPGVIFYGRQPPEEMPRFYAMADAMLLTLRDDPLLCRTLPGKTQSYMAAAKPILGAVGGEAESVIREAGCGFCGPAEDAAALAENIRRFLRCGDKAAMGANARRYYEAHFSRTRFIDALESILREAAG